MARVLIVDDEPLILRTFAAILKADGHETWRASRATKAQAILSKQEIDVVVSDVVMPEMNGISLLELISRHWPTTKVILITGQSTQDLRVAAHTHGAYDYLIKPISHTELCEIVQRAATARSANK
jgi:two-component system NtrC family sensor kinase